MVAYNSLQREQRGSDELSSLVIQKFFNESKMKCLVLIIYLYLLKIISEALLV